MVDALPWLATRFDALHDALPWSTPRNALPWLGFDAAGFQRPSVVDALPWLATRFDALPDALPWLGFDADSTQLVSASADTPDMTQPRMALPGTTYLVTRTCAERRFFLRPDPIVNQAFAFCLARAQRCHPDVEVHAVSVQSNHFHALVTDLRGGGELSDFMHALNTLMGRFLQSYLRDLAPGGTLERIWSRRSFSAVAQVGERAVLQSLAYTLVNPVRHALVADYRKWPGFNTRPAHWAMNARSTERPELYFDQSDDSLRSLPLRLTPPPALRQGRTLHDVVRDVEDVVLSEQRRLVAEHAASGTRILGVKAALATDPMTQPNTPRKPSTIDPQFAAGGDGSALRAARKLLRGFRAAYREAWNAFKQGEWLPFPFGTIQMCRRFRAHVAPEFLPPWCLPAPAA